MTNEKKEKKDEPRIFHVTAMIEDIWFDKRPEVQWAIELMIEKRFEEAAIVENFNRTVFVGADILATEDQLTTLFSNLAFDIWDINVTFAPIVFEAEAVDDEGHPRGPTITVTYDRENYEATKPALNAKRDERAAAAREAKAKAKEAEKKAKEMEEEDVFV